MKKALVSLLVFAWLSLAMNVYQPHNQQVDPTPPKTPVKLIFIHHSTGGNWLADPAGNELGGGLGRALMENHYYVSATNYGWGPDSIGDATDIPNWVDWFRGERSPEYLQALYRENGQNFGDFGSWPRLEADPGGENQVILFKSCFPNSDLEGSPDDPPSMEGGLSVGHAKYVYNEILKYFATRPDKLFVVITAPPLGSSAHGANARAFNQWLVEDWLKENNYSQPNVAVFDFYNVLTGSDHHHRVVNGQIEHSFQPGKNLLVYPSGDDHPSRVGNEKATLEFVSLLNVFYNRWQAAGYTKPVEETQSLPLVSPEDDSNTEAFPSTTGLFNDGFESRETAWEANVDETGKTQISCKVVDDQAHQGSQALRITYQVAAEGWATCSRFFESPQNWKTAGGLSLAIQPGAAGGKLHIDIYAGSPDSQESYYYVYETPAKTDGWTVLTIPWDAFKRVEWEENAGSSFSKTSQVLGMAIGFPGEEAQTTGGTLWVDDIQLIEPPGGETAKIAPTTPPEAGQPAQPPPVQPEKTAQPLNKGGLPVCSGALVLPLVLVWGARRFSRK